MKSAAVKKKLSVPTLAERVEALKQEVDDELTNLSEIYRPSTVPGPVLKRMWLSKTVGTAFEAYLLLANEKGL